MERIPYLAPGLVGPEKAARGKLPTDVWWHTIVPTNGGEKTGYPNQKPEGVLRRIVQASSQPGDRVLDFFAGSGTTGVAAASSWSTSVVAYRRPANPVRSPPSSRTVRIVRRCCTFPVLNGGSM